MSIAPPDALPGLDVPRVTEWITGRIPEAQPPLSFERVGHGRSNITFVVLDAAAHRWVLRRPPLGPLLPSAHDMAREHRVLEGLSATAVPVPRPMGLCTDLEVTGAPFYLMEHVEGHILADRAAGLGLPKPARRAGGLSLACTRASLHAVDVDAAGLGTLGRREG